MPRSIFRSLIVVAVLTFASDPTLAQQIQGKVRYMPGYQPASDIPIQCTGSSCSGRIYTDREGNFRFIFPRPGYYIITIDIPGYLVETRSFAMLDRGQTEYVFFQLRPDPKAHGQPTAPPGVINAKIPIAAQKEFEEGHKAVEEGRPEDGIPHLEKAVKLYPHYLEAELLLGTAYMDQKQWQKAEAALRRAIAIDAKHAEAHFALGELYHQQKRYPEAEKALLDGLKIEERSWQGHLTLARVYFDMGEMTKAGPEVGKALVLNPNLAEARLLGGDIMLRLHRPADALVQFEEYLKLEPKGKFAEQTRAVVEKIKKELAEKK